MLCPKLPRRPRRVVTLFRYTISWLFGFHCTLWKHIHSIAHNTICRRTLFSVICSVASCCVVWSVLRVENNSRKHTPALLRAFVLEQIRELMRLFHTHTHTHKQTKECIVVQHTHTDSQRARRHRCQVEWNSTVLWKKLSRNKRKSLKTK